MQNKTNKEEVVLELLTSLKTSFSDTDLQNQINLHGDYSNTNDPYQGWRRVYPELFGHKLPSALRFVGFELIPIDQVTWDDQQWRIGGKSTKKTEIGQNIERNGYKLKYPPISVFFYDDLSRKTITGNTRTGLLGATPFFMENLIIARYEADADAVSEEVEDAIEECAGMFNSIHDPAATLSPQDAKRIVELSVLRFNKTKGKYGTPCTIDALLQKIDRVCGEGVFQPATRSNLAYEVWNNFKPEEQVISWSKSGKTEFKVERFMQKDAKFMDTENVKYYVSSTQTPAQAWHKAMKLSAENPKSQIRVVLHTGTLSGFDLGKTYRGRLSEFMSSWKEMTKNACLALYGKENPLISNIVVYSALPALGSEHNTKKPFFFDHKKETCYQKYSDGGHTFDYTDPEGTMSATLDLFME